MTIPVVSLLNETDLVRLVYNAISVNFDEQITLADLRKTILAGGTNIDLETIDAAPAVFIRNKSSTVARYPEFNATNYAGSFQGYPLWTFYNIPGSFGSPSAPGGNFPLGSFIANSHDGIDFGAGAAIEFRTANGWTVSSHGSRIVFKTVKDGETGNPVDRMAIENDGKITLTPPITVTGSRSDGTALCNLLAQLSARGVIVDNTTP